ncbi:hypothetical protein GN244_ATG15100 [Phytophthora infestans]|nr:hypothetical protein GN244_ATG15100 [Phytophthora infestans]
MGVAFLLNHTQSTSLFVENEFDDTLDQLDVMATRYMLDDRELALLQDEIGHFVTIKESWLL